MSLDKTDVEKIAHLARLAIDDSDIPRLCARFNTIFRFSRTTQRRSLQIFRLWHIH